MAAFSDDVLMAYADGELDAPARAEIEAAMLADEVLAQRVAQHRVLRERVQSAFARELTEPVPERLLAAARGNVKATVTDLARTRELRAQPGRRGRPHWQPLLSMAASVLAGVGLGYWLMHDSNALIDDRGDGLMAQGSLAGALSTQLGGDPSAGVRVGLSFRSKSGDYCRVFTLHSQASPTGVACRRSGGWQILALAQPAAEPSAAGSQGEYRTASSALPAAILDVVQQQMVGDPLDGDGEQSARGKGWRAGPP